MHDWRVIMTTIKTEAFRFFVKHTKTSSILVIVELKSLEPIKSNCETSNGVILQLNAFKNYCNFLFYMSESSFLARENESQNLLGSKPI